jgi:hypothetical protein
MLGIAYAGLGRKAEAVKEANLALSFAASSNMMNECEMRLYLAQIYVMNRDFFNALPVIAKLLNSPSMFSEKMLYLDPVWKPFMDEPDYRKKIMKYL